MFVLPAIFRNQKSLRSATTVTGTGAAFLVAGVALAGPAAAAQVCVQDPTAPYLELACVGQDAHVEDRDSASLGVGINGAASATVFTPAYGAVPICVSRLTAGYEASSGGPYFDWNGLRYCY